MSLTNKTALRGSNNEKGRKRKQVYFDEVQQDEGIYDEEGDYYENEEEKRLEAAFDQRMGGGAVDADARKKANKRSNLDIQKNLEKHKKDKPPTIVPLTTTQLLGPNGLTSLMHQTQQMLNRHTDVRNKEPQLAKQLVNLLNNWARDLYPRYNVEDTFRKIHDHLGPSKKETREYLKLQRNLVLETTLAQTLVPDIKEKVWNAFLAKDSVPLESHVNDQEEDEDYVPKNGNVVSPPSESLAPKAMLPPLASTGLPAVITPRRPLQYDDDEEEEANLDDVRPASLDGNNDESKSDLIAKPRRKVSKNVMLDSSDDEDNNHKPEDPEANRYEERQVEEDDQEEAEFEEQIKTLEISSKDTLVSKSTKVVAARVEVATPPKLLLNHAEVQPCMSPIITPLKKVKLSLQASLDPLTFSRNSPSGRTFEASSTIQRMSEMDAEVTPTDIQRSLPEETPTQVLRESLGDTPKIDVTSNPGQANSANHSEESPDIEKEDRIESESSPAIENTVTQLMTDNQIKQTPTKLRKQVQGDWRQSPCTKIIEETRPRSLAIAEDPKMPETREKVNVEIPIPTFHANQEAIPTQVMTLWNETPTQVMTFEEGATQALLGTCSNQDLGGGHDPIYVINRESSSSFDIDNRNSLIEEMTDSQVDEEALMTQP